MLTGSRRNSPGESWPFHPRSIGHECVSLGAVDENEITKFVRKVIASNKLVVRASKRLVARKGSKHLVMARARLVDARQNYIDDLQDRRPADALRGQGG